VNTYAERLFHGFPFPCVVVPNIGLPKENYNRAVSALLHTIEGLSEYEVFNSYEITPVSPIFFEHFDFLI
jgi:hypothetical protein